MPWESPFRFILMAKDVAQCSEYLPNEALGSVPSIPKKKKLLSHLENCLTSSELVCLELFFCSRILMVSSDMKSLERGLM